MDRQEIIIVNIRDVAKLQMENNYLAEDVAPVYVALIRIESKSANVINKCSLVAG